jgi:hypothetical protein
MKRHKSYSEKRVGFINYDFSAVLCYILSICKIGTVNETASGIRAMEKIWSYTRSKATI